ncbi:uncharacterized protein LOC134220803 [Armigeres subalbatus]|uniref:uncharacterized protein LOC134220803 n=1 Tax=Armigeres subalbatus TaxID=124917 RepID=UPI002ED4676C
MYYEVIKGFLQGYKQNNMVELMDESLNPDLEQTSSAATQGPERDEASAVIDTNDMEVEFLDNSESCIVYEEISEPPSPQSPVLTHSLGLLNDKPASPSKLSPSARPPVRPVTSSAPESSKKRSKLSTAKHGRKSVQERLLNMAEKENEKFEIFMRESQETDQKIIEPMKENIQLFERMITKM